MERRMTVREALLQASSLLAENGAFDGRHEAELLLMHLLGWDRSRLLLDGGEGFPAELAERWQAMLDLRCAGEPVQYIIGEQEFYGRPFEVVRGAVLIPRPETELLVEAVAKRIGALWGGGAGAGEGYAGVDAGKGKGRNIDAFTGRIADIGTGSGAIAVTLACQLLNWQVMACDLSPDALAVARRNAARNGVAERVTFYEGDLLGPLLSGGDNVDVLVSNPPYIESGDMPGLQREVRDYEPHMALDGGVDGLRFYREIVRQVGLLASMPRLIGFEVGMGQAQDVRKLLVDAGFWSNYEIVTDYSGIERHVLGWR